MNIKISAHFADTADKIRNVYAIVSRGVKHVSEIPQVEIVKLTQDGAASNKKWKENVSWHNSLKKRLRIRVVATDAAGNIVAKKTTKVRWQP